MVQNTGHILNRLGPVFGLFIGLICSFLVLNTAQAQSALGQTDASASSTAFSFTAATTTAQLGFNLNYNDSTSTLTGNISGTMSGVILRTWNTPGKTLTTKIFVVDASQGYGGSAQIFAWDAFNISGGDATTTLDLSSPSFHYLNGNTTTTLSAGTAYRIFIDFQADGTAQEMKIYGSLFNGAPVQKFPYPDLDNFSFSPLRSPYFRFVGLETTVPTGGAGNNFISLLFPFDGSISPDFPLWHISYTLATSTTGALVIDFSKSDGSESYRNVAVVTSSTGDIHFAKQEALSLGAWGANALLQVGGQTYDQSGINVFTITSASTSPISIATASSTCGTTFLVSDLCSLAFSLFVPDSAHLNQFSTSTDCSDLVCTAKNKAPFSFIYGTVTAFQGISSSTPASLGGVYSVFQTFGLLAILTIIDGFLALVITAGFLFWLFERGRHIEL